MKYFIFLFAFCTLISCNKKSEAEYVADIVLSVDPTEAQKINLSELIDTAYVIPVSLPDSIYSGLIEQVELLNDGSILLLDPYVAESVLLLHKDGSFRSQLYKKGQGPGEYSNIFYFSTNPSQSQIAIFDRLQLQFHVYGIPSFEFIDSFRYPNYTMYMQWVRDDLMYIMNEDLSESGKTLGLQLFDWRRGELIDSFFQNDFITSVELAYPNTFRKQLGNHYFAYQSPLVNIMQLTETGITPKLSIDFGKATPSDEFFSQVDSEIVENSLEDYSKATWVRHFSFNGPEGIFHYIYKNPDNQHLAFVDMKSLQTKVFLNPQWETLRSGSLPTPIGQHEDYFIYSVTFDELISDFYKQKDMLSQSLLRSVNMTGFEVDQVYLLFLKYKNPLSKND